MIGLPIKTLAGPNLPDVNNQSTHSDVICYLLQLLILR